MYQGERGKGVSTNPLDFDGISILPPVRPVPDRNVSTGIRGSTRSSADSRRTTQDVERNR